MASAPPSSSPSASPVFAPSPPPVVQQELDPMLRLAQLEVQLQTLQARAVSVANSNVPRPKAPPMSLFNGLMGSNGFEVDQWIREVCKQFAHFGDKTFPDDRTKIQFAVEWLTGAAQDWWENEDKRGVMNWDSFVERLRQRYRPQMPAELARQRLRTLVQRGRCETYCNEFLKLVSRIPNRSEEDKIFDFKAGLDRPLAAKVAEKQPKTLQEAMEIAVQAEPYVSTRIGASSNVFRVPSSFARPSSNSSSTSFGSVPMELNAVASFEVPAEESDFNIDSSDPPAVSNINNIHAHGIEAMQLLLTKMENMENRLLSMQQNRSGNRPSQKTITNRDRNIPGLTAADIATLQKEGRCFRCKQKGHMKNACPQLRLKY